MTPTVFTPGITDHVTLYCGLNETTPTGTHGLVGRDVTNVEEIEFNNDVTDDDDGDVTTTSAAIDYITSIVISRQGGEVLATTSDHHPARHFLNTSSVDVTGDVSGAGVTGVGG